MSAATSAPSRLARRTAGWRARLSRVRAWLPLTNLGVVVAVVAAWTYWGFARPRADFAFAVVCLLALAMVGLALAGVVLGSALLASRLKRLPDGDPVTFEAVRGFSLGLTLPGWAVLPMIEITWTWEQPDDVDVELSRVGGRLMEELSGHVRARAETIRRRFVVEDGFGLARWVLWHTERRSLRVLPFMGRLDQAPLLQSLAAGDDLPHPRGRPEGDRVDMRRYVPGDPLRLALWKVYARTRQLMVRTPERALSASLRVVAYLPSARGDEPAAALARWAIERGAFGDDWVFGADGSAGRVDSAPEAIERIVQSRGARGTEQGDGAGLARFLDASGGLADAKVVLFLPGRAGPWLDRVTSVLRGRRCNVTCVVGLDGLRREEASPPLPARLRGWLERPAPPRPAEEAIVDPEELERVTRQLRAARAQVVIIDRAAGRRLPGVGRGELEDTYGASVAKGGRAA